ncbi:MAG: hypothetical protein JO363_12490 [Solirubrobacterales bacterium]|nr:hypothetical protein [Solirubrobacterales bacterium]
MISEYEPATYLAWISPTPLLMCVAEDDVLTPTDIAIAGYATANKPKKLIIMPSGHFNAYIDGFDLAAATAAQLFSEQLINRSAVLAPVTARRAHDTTGVS